MASANRGAAKRKAPGTPTDIIGVRLRQARQKQGFSLRALAAEVGVTASLLSQIETGHVKPSVETLFGLSEALRVPTCFFLEPDPTQIHRLPDDGLVADSLVLHRTERRTLQLAHGVEWASLLVTEEPDFELVEISYPPGSVSSETMQRHGGRDYFVVLEGRLTIQCAFTVCHLGPGDSIAFEAGMPHQLRNDGSTVARAIAIVRERHGVPHGGIDCGLVHLQ